MWIFVNHKNINISTLYFLILCILIIYCITLFIETYFLTCWGWIHLFNWINLMRRCFLLSLLLLLAAVMLQFPAVINNILNQSNQFLCLCVDIIILSSSILLSLMLFIIKVASAASTENFYIFSTYKILQHSCYISPFHQCFLTCTPLSHIPSHFQMLTLLLSLSDTRTHTHTCHVIRKSLLVADGDSSVCPWWNHIWQRRS